ncbi:hypothetical protein J6590_041861 [Homalodisca vitripennis]|nr:hypothetical protein J6590_041861 [Homalodisca vitripennis]
MRINWEESESGPCRRKEEERDMFIGRERDGIIYGPAAICGDPASDNCLGRVTLTTLTLDLTRSPLRHHQRDAPRISKGCYSESCKTILDPGGNQGVGTIPEVREAIQLTTPPPLHHNNHLWILVTVWTVQPPSVPSGVHHWSSVIRFVSDSCETIRHPVANCNRCLRVKAVITAVREMAVSTNPSQTERGRPDPTVWGWTAGVSSPEIAGGSGERLRWQ